jgi:hypothetical protein
MEKTMTGKMQAIITKVSSHEIMNTKTIATMMKRKERMNIDTFVERPS